MINFARFENSIRKLLYIFVTLVGLCFIIAVHELGHFTFCKIFGISTPVFSIGFGPTLFKKKIGETTFKLALMPLGGYVQIFGMGADNHKQELENRVNLKKLTVFEQEFMNKEVSKILEKSFESKPYWQKLLVMFGGVLFNILFACLVFLVIFLTEKRGSSIIEKIIPDSPADISELKEYDNIVKINGIDTENSIEKIFSITESLSNQATVFTVLRNEKPLDISIKLGKKNYLGRTYSGLIFKQDPKHHNSIIKAIKNSFMQLILTSKQTLISLKRLFSLNPDTQKSVNMITVLPAAIDHLKHRKTLFIFILAAISINLAIVNLFPLPVLDGGQIMLYSIEELFGRKLPTATKEIITIISWIILIGVIVFTSFKDIIIKFLEKTNKTN